MLWQANQPAVAFAQGPLVRWLKVNFSETFMAWIHIKALRVFTESVLRYDGDFWIIRIITHRVLLNITFSSSCFCL